LAEKVRGVPGGLEGADKIRKFWGKKIMKKYAKPTTVYCSEQQKSLGLRLADKEIRRVKTFLFKTKIALKILGKFRKLRFLS
jgi:hypothetical protein